MRVFVIFTWLYFTVSSKKLSSTKVNVNYVESSIDIFKFYQQVLNFGATMAGMVTISWLHYQIYHILVVLTQFLQVNETVISITKF